MLEEKLGPSLPSFPLSIIHPLGPLFRHLPLALRRHLLYLRTTSRWGNFRSPKLWSEKMQWRILNDRRPVLSWTADKLAHKEYVRETLKQSGMEGVLKFPEVYWVGTDIRDLQKYSHLLPPRWVLKPNHSSGRFKLIDSSKQAVNWEELIALGDLWAGRDEEEWMFGHWAYGEARHTLIVEERIGEGIEPDAEVKCWVYNGTLESFTLRHTLTTMKAVFDRSYARMSYSDDRELPYGVPTKFELIPIEIRDRMRAAAEMLVAQFDHARVDLFIENDQLWFNEISTYMRSGLGRITEADERRRGELWVLPDLNAPDPNVDEWRALLGPLPQGSLQRSP